MSKIGLEFHLAYRKAFKFDELHYYWVEIHKKMVFVGINLSL